MAVGGLLLGVLTAANPFQVKPITSGACAAVWLGACAVVVLVSAHPLGRPLAVLGSGLLLGLPCLVSASPLARALLMCGVLVPFAAAVAFEQARPKPGLRPRVAVLFDWHPKIKLRRGARKFDAGALGQLLAATAVLGVVIEVVILSGRTGFWLALRWLAGGIMVLAYAEMATAALRFVTGLIGITVPPLMDSPYRSASIGEFWTRRWNIFASENVFYPFCFAPLARWSPTAGMLAAFALSGVGHLLLALMAIGDWDLALSWGVFFWVQPLFILVERRMKVRWWQRAAAWGWTLTALAISSPLFVEPALRIIEASWGTPKNALAPALAVLGFVGSVSIVVALGSRTGCAQANTEHQAPDANSASRFAGTGPVQASPR